MTFKTEKFCGANGYINYRISNEKGDVYAIAFDESTANVIVAALNGNQTAKPIPQDEVVRDLRNCVETLNQSLDNYYDVTGDNDESADDFIKEIKAKYNF